MTPFAFAVVASIGFAAGVALCLVLFVATGGTREAPTDWQCCQAALRHLHDEHRAERVERGRARGLDRVGNAGPPEPVASEDVPRLLAPTKNCGATGLFNGRRAKCDLDPGHKGDCAALFDGAWLPLRAKNPNPPPGPSPAHPPVGWNPWA